MSEATTFTRRTWLATAGAGAAALAWNGVSRAASTGGRSAMGLSTACYGVRWRQGAGDGSLSQFRDAADLLDHAGKLGAGGAQAVVRDWDAAQQRRLREIADAYGLYLEGQVRLPRGEDELAAFDRDIQSAHAAGADVVRTVCLSGRRYETFHTAEAWDAFVSQSRHSLQLAEPIVRRHGVKLAVENHKDWRVDEMLDLLRMLGSESVGICLDMGNSIALLEDAMTVVEAYAPFTVTTHFKDMGLKGYSDGFLLSEVPLGRGRLDLAKMIAVCRAAKPAVRFNLEMITRDPLQVPCLTDAYWTTMPQVTGRELAHALTAARSASEESNEPLPTVAGLSNDERLAAEEANVVASIAFAKNALGL